MDGTPLNVGVCKCLHACLCVCVCECVRTFGYESVKRRQHVFGCFSHKTPNNEK